MGGAANESPAFLVNTANIRSDTQHTPHRPVFLGYRMETGLTRRLTVHFVTKHSSRQNHLGGTLLQPGIRPCSGQPGSQGVGEGGQERNKLHLSPNTHLTLRLFNNPPLPPLPPSRLNNLVSSGTRFCRQHSACQRADKADSEMLTT